MITILYVLCLLHPPSHTFSLFRHQTQKTQIKCALVFPVIFMPRPVNMAVARGSPTHLLQVATFSKSNGTLSIAPFFISLQCRRVSGSFLLQYVIRFQTNPFNTRFRHGEEQHVVPGVCPTQPYPSQVNSVQCKYSPPPDPQIWHKLILAPGTCTQ